MVHVGFELNMNKKINIICTYRHCKLYLYEQKEKPAWLQALQFINNYVSFRLILQKM